MSTHTGLLLLQGQVVPVNLHAVTELHPQLSLLLRRHGLPTLLDTSQGRVGDGMLAGGSTGLLGRNGGLLSAQGGHWAGGRTVRTDDRRWESRAASSCSRDGSGEHCVGDGAGLKTGQLS